MGLQTMVAKPLWKEGWAAYTLQVRTDWMRFQLTMQPQVFVSKTLCGSSFRKLVHLLSH